jgi:thiol-disulfide isomerase/thioredoxin
MKLSSFLLLNWLLIAWNTNVLAPKAVLITGKVNVATIKEVSYTIPLRGVFHWGIKGTSRVDAQGNFQIKIPCEQTSIVAIGGANQTKKTFIVSPEDHFTLNLGSEKDEDFFEAKGPNEEGQKLFQALPHPGLVQIAARRYLKDTVISEIKSKIAAQKAKDLEPFSALLKVQKITPAFFELVKADRDCYYAAMQAQLVWSKLQTTDLDKIKSFSPAHKAWFAETLREYPINSKSLIRSFWWEEYANIFQDVSILLDKDFDPKQQEERYKNESDHTIKMKDASKCFSGAFLEYFQFSYLYNTCSQNNYEKELIALFEQFKQQYPKSPFTKYLQPLVDPIVEYHQAQAADFSDQYKFVENYASLNSLEEALKAFKGKKLYIDVWATWCGPCKAEFAHKEGLKKLLAEKGYDILYISIDEPERDEAWKGMIKFYKLEGYHLRSNKDFTSDLVKIYDQGGSWTIPWYFIVNEQGKIVNADAQRPSNLKGLEGQL